MPLKYFTLQHVALSKIVNVFNQAFANYFVPIHFTEESLAIKMQQEGTQLAYSVGAFDNKQLIGVILQGFREENGVREVYNGGTGVLPEYRGQQVTEHMYQFILPHLRENNIHTAWLEVITENHRAIKVYERVGYQKKRKVVCWKGNLPISLQTTSIAVSFHSINTMDWAEISKLGNVIPTWQNSNFAISNRLTTHYITGMYINNNNLIGYAIVNLLTGQIGQFAIHPLWRRKKMGTLLFRHIAQLCSTNLSIINVPADATPLLAFLKNIGFTITLSQFEMQLKLA